MRDAPIQPVQRGDTRSLMQTEFANQLIGAVNRTLTMRVQIVNTGNSRFEISGENAVLVISTKDIDIGVVQGAKGGNAALGSLLTALGTTFKITDQTT